MIIITIFPILSLEIFVSGLERRKLGRKIFLPVSVVSLGVSYLGWKRQDIVVNESRPLDPKERRRLQEEVQRR